MNEMDGKSSRAVSDGYEGKNIRGGRISRGRPGYVENDLTMGWAGNLSNFMLFLMIPLIYFTQ